MIRHNKTFFKLIKKFLIILLIVFIITGIIKLFIFEAYTIEGSSMNPNLNHRDELIVLKFSYGPRIPIFNIKLPILSKPKSGQILVFESIDNINPKWHQELLDFITLGRINFKWKKHNKMIIKRILGEPGDTIRIEKDNSQGIYINGKLIEQEFITKLENNNLGKKDSIFMEKNKGKEYFVQFQSSELTLTNRAKIKTNEIYIPKRNDVLTLTKLNNTEMNIYINDIKMSNEWEELHCLERINEETKIDLINFDNNTLCYTIKNNYYFVRGDNRISEYSSRDSTDWGILREDLIIGTPVFRVLPFKKFGLIN